MEELKKTPEQFMKEVISIHGNTYDYSKSEYQGMFTKLIIICKDHGEFLQQPSHHIHRKQGCPICKSSKGEALVIQILQKNNVKFEPQKTFKDCRYKNLLRFDFYLPKYNLLIEFDGIQHFEPVKHFGGEKVFKLQQIKDQIKDDFANESLTSLLRIYYTMDFEDIEKLILNVLNSNKNVYVEKEHFCLNLFN